MTESALGPARLVVDERPMSQALPQLDEKSKWGMGAMAIMTGAVIALAFLLHVFGTSQIYYAKQQRILFDEFRYALANATAPVGQVTRDDQLVAQGTPVALITIPSIGVNAVVVEGTSPSAMLSGVGHRRDTPLPGQAGTSVIFGRQLTYGGTFAALDQVNKGDKIEVTTGQGEHTYIVDRLRYTGDPIPTTSDTESYLTLVSAYGIPLSPTSVIRVDAHLSGEPAVTPAQMYTVESLPQSELANYGDTQAWGILALELLVMGILAIVFWLTARYWGVLQTWIVAVPIGLTLGIATAIQLTLLMPNLV